MHPRPAIVGGSRQGTLNHILAGDQIWLHRIEAAGPIPAVLDAILLYDDLPACG